MSTIDHPEGLNAGAAAFIPGVPTGAPPVAPPYEGGYDDGDDDEAIMDEIEAEVAKQGGGGLPSAGGFQSQYNDLPPHAEEFWFPECRDCSCCSGYKHGCSCCRTQGMRSCKCAPSRGPTAMPSSGLMPAPPGPRTAVPPPHAYSGGGRGGGGGVRGPPMCRFFQSPQGCRFGDNCRFSHG